MKFLLAFLFFVGVYAQDFAQISKYSENACGGTATDLGYFVFEQCWGFDGYIDVALNNSAPGYVRYQAQCTTGCMDCTVNQNVALGACTSDNRIITQDNPTLNTPGGMAFEFFADSGCTTLQAVKIILPDEACFALTNSTSFFMQCENDVIEYFTCDDVSCGGSCNKTGSYPTNSSGICYPSTMQTYNLPTYWEGYCDVYPPVAPTTSTSTTASATTTTTTGEATSTTTTAAAATTTTTTEAATTTTTEAATSTTTTEAATTTSTTGASATTTTTEAATTTTTEAATTTTTGAAATTTTTTGAAATTTTTTGAATTTTTAAPTTTTTGAATTTTTGAATTTTTGAATTTTTGATTTTTTGPTTTTTGAAATTTTGNATATTTSGTGNTSSTATATPTTMKITTSNANSLTFGVLISAVCISVILLI